MKKPSLVVTCLAVQLGVGVLACSRGADSSAVPDGGDTDSLGDAGCGTADVVCCDTAPACVEGHASVTTDGTDCWCHAMCELAMCEDPDESWAFDVACQDVGGGIGACMADEDLAAGQDCGEVGETCATISGYDGMCLSDGTDEYCLSACAPIADTGCDIAHACLPLINTSTGEFVGAACIPSA